MTEYYATITIDPVDNERLEGIARYNRVFFPLSVRRGRRCGSAILELLNRQRIRAVNDLREALQRDLVTQ